MLNKKSLSPLIATILLIVVSVILVIIVLTWGKNVFLTSLSPTDTIFTEADSYLYMFSFQKLQNNNLIFKNISSSNKDIIIVGYKINSFYDHKLLNKINYLQEPTTLSPGSLANIKIVVPPEESFSVEFYTDDNKYITLSNIRETNPVHNFFAVFGGDLTNALGQNSIIQTSDGGYLLLGDTASYGAGSTDIWLIKTDSQGNTCDYSSNGNCTGTGTFAKTFGGASSEYPTQILEGSDGGYLLLGRTTSYGAGSDAIWLIKTDSSGNTCDYSSNGNCTGTGTFAKTFGGSNYQSPTQILESSDGDYLLLGYTASYGAGSDDIWLIKTDSQGNTCEYSSNGNCTGTDTFAKTFGGASYENPTQILESSDGGYLLLGNTGSYGAGSEIWLIKTDSQGNTCDYSSNGNCTGTGTFAKTFGGASSEYPTQILEGSDGGYLLLGDTASYGAGSTDIWLIKTDSQGNTCDYSSNGNCTGTGTFAKTFGGASYESPTQILEGSDGDYLLLGNTGSYGAGSSDIWLIKTDSLGNTCDYSSNGNCTGTGTFAKTFGGSSHDSPTQILESSDGGYFIFGRNEEIYGESDYGNLYMIKTNSVGEIILEKTIGGKMVDYFYSFYQTTDGGAIVGGLTASYGGVHEDWECNIKILILKIDKNGNINIDNLPESTFIGEEFGCDY